MKNKIKNLKFIIIIAGVLALIGLFLPYEKSIGEYRQNLKENPTTLYLEEVNLKNKDVIDISIIENFKVYTYAVTNNDGNNWLYGEAIINTVITITLILSIALIILFTLLKKSVLTIIFSIIMGISSLLMNYDIVDRGVIPSSNYTYGFAYYLFIPLAILILVCSIITIINNKKQNRENYISEEEIGSERDKLKNKSLILKIIVSLFIILTIIIVCFLIFNRSNKDNNENSLQNNDSNNFNDVVQNSNLEELKLNSKTDIENLTKDLESEWNIISREIITFEQYKNNQDRIDNFYKKIADDSNDFSIKVREYALKYAQVILNSNNSFSDKYDDLEKLYDDIYDEILEDLYDSIYDELLEEMYDYYYDGILDDAYDNVPYEDYSNIRSHEYNNYSSTRSKVYNAYSNARSDIYDFYSKLRNALYSNDLEEAKEDLENFNNDIKNI